MDSTSKAASYIWDKEVDIRSLNRRQNASSKSVGIGNLGIGFSRLDFSGILLYILLNLLKSEIDSPSFLLTDPNYVI